MGQVPVYGIIGGGRVAKHFSQYFDLSHIPFKTWTRKSLRSIEDSLDGAEIILILVSDSAIEKVIAENPFLKNRKLVHFSGSLVSSQAWGAHPLMSFSDRLYDLEVYRRIPFVVEEGNTFKNYFPTLVNPSYSIKAKNKNLYHAMCVLSGNFTTILWNKFFETLESQFQIPRQAAFPYLEQVADNVKNLGPSALTGPIVRKDTVTISNNLKALEGDPFENVYRAFVEIYENRS
jgi:2-dehydropantoate 2-reductase